MLSSMDQPSRLCKKEIHLAVTVCSWLAEISRQHTRLQRQLEEEKKSTTRRTARSGQLEENISTTHRATWTIQKKYFDYFILNIVDCALPRSGARRRALTKTIGKRSGARHQLAPECRTSYSRPAISSTSAADDPNKRLGARQQLRLRSWLWFYDNNSTMSSSTTLRRPRRTR
jgi:hypothetical protein